MSQSDGFNIFHMSDLHFNGKNLELIKIVLHHLVEAAPRYVFITGDFVEGPADDLDVAVTMIRNAIREVERVSGFLPMLKVVPGNHDFFYKGTYGLRRTWKFYRLFTEEERGNGFSPEDMIAVATFDSNQIFEPRGGIWRKTIQLMRAMSHGLIIERDLDAFSEWTRQLRQSHDGEKYARSFKVALLHHHPMPTRYSFLPRMADEGFMMLENAGALLYRLIQENFDLIIHGHRHFPQFCRAVYKNQDGEERSVAVLACGSSAKKHDDLTRIVGHNFNIIRISWDGSVHAEQYFRRSTGAFLPGPNRTLIRGPRKPLISQTTKLGDWFGPIMGH
ncbi:MAG: metallophosphoesterase [Deltaproteobacteria bacterium]|nr:metallophosphoesterase [Candidatus Zymogenaceae bacterium]